MSVDVIIPWKDGCIYRKLNLDWTMKRWESHGFSPKLGILDEAEPFVKALAVAEALKDSTAEVTVVTDGDLWVHDAIDCIQDCLDGRPWAMPHHEICRMNPHATSRVLGGGEFGPPWAQRPYRAVLGGGIVVLRREVYDAAPLDPRFVGWGQEDESWGLALRTMFPGGREASGQLFHLWHPPADRRNRRNGSQESVKLRNRYAIAKKSPESMRALLAEM